MVFAEISRYRDITANLSNLSKRPLRPFRFPLVPRTVPIILLGTVVHLILWSGFDRYYRPVSTFFDKMMDLSESANHGWVARFYYIYMLL